MVSKKNRQFPPHNSDERQVSHGICFSGKKYRRAARMDKFFPPFEYLIVIGDPVRNFLSIFSYLQRASYSSSMRVSLWTTAGTFSSERASLASYQQETFAKTMQLIEARIDRGRWQPHSFANAPTTILQKSFQSSITFRSCWPGVRSFAIFFFFFSNFAYF